MERLNSKLGTNVFRLAGSNTPPQLKNELALEIINRGLKVKYVCFGHARSADEVDYNLLHQSGCLSLSFGVESGSQEILDRDINKKVKIDQVSSALKQAKAAKLLTVASIIAPCPHDTPETLEQTVQFLIEAKPDSVTTQPPGVIPGTYWYSNFRRFGFELDEDYISKLMTYRIRLLLPPILWQKLPYQMNGREHYELMAETGNVSRSLSENGIVTEANDILISMAYLINVATKEFRNQTKKFFFTANYMEIQDIVSLFNNQAAL